MKRNKKLIILSSTIAVTTLPLVMLSASCNENDEKIEENIVGESNTESETPSSSVEDEKSSTSTIQPDNPGNG